MMRTVLLLVAVLVPLVTAAVVVLVVVLVATRSRARPAPPLVAPGPGGAPVLAPSTWQAELVGDGVLGSVGSPLASTYGVLVLDGGRLSFTRTGQAEPDWVVDCRELGVRRQGIGPFTVAAVRLFGPMGEVPLNVSQEHINRFSTNSLKDFRQSGYADQLVAALHAHGARPV